MRKVFFMLLIALAIFSFASCKNEPAHTPAASYIGTKAPGDAKAVGDVVFTDGSASPYTEDFTDAQKAAAIAVIFYAGDSNGVLGAKTLGVGLERFLGGVRWCLETANACNVCIDTIQCNPKGSKGAYTFDANCDNDGSDNLSQIATKLGTNDDTATEANYPAFYFAKNYKTQATNLAGTSYEDVWYLPSLAELFEIWRNKTAVDTASEGCGGKIFGSNYYWSSSQYVSASYENVAYGFDFSDGSWNIYYKYGDYHFASAVRAF